MSKISSASSLKLNFDDLKTAVVGMAQNSNKSNIIIVRKQKLKTQFLKEHPNMDVRVSAGYPPNLSCFVTDFFEKRDVPKKEQKKLAKASQQKIFQEAAKAKIITWESRTTEIAHLFNEKSWLFEWFVVALMQENSLFEDYLKKAPCKHTDENGRTLLHLAALTGQSERVRLLIGQGSLVDKPDYYGNTALHYSCMVDDKKSQEYLKKDGAAKADVRNIFKAIPFDYYTLLQPADDKEKVEVHRYDEKTKTLEMVSSREIRAKFTSLDKVTLTADALIDWFLARTPRDMLAQVGACLNMKKDFYTKSLETQMKVCLLSSPKPMTINPADVFFAYREPEKWGLFATKNLFANHPVAFYGGIVCGFSTGENLPDSHGRSKYWLDFYYQKTLKADSRTLIYDAVDSLTLGVFFNTSTTEKGANVKGSIVLNQGVLQTLFKTIRKVQKGEQLLIDYGDFYRKNVEENMISLEKQTKLTLKNKTS